MDEATKRVVEQANGKGNGNGFNPQRPAQQPQQTAPLGSSKSELLRKKLAEQANTLGETKVQAQQQIIQSGIEEGLEEAKLYMDAKRLGLLMGITQGESNDAIALPGQLSQVSAYADCANTSQAEWDLEAFLADTENSLKESRKALTPRQMPQLAPSMGSLDLSSKNSASSAPIGNGSKN